MDPAPDSHLFEYRDYIKLHDESIYRQLAHFWDQRLRVMAWWERRVIRLLLVSIIRPAFDFFFGVALTLSDILYERLHCFVR